jgi:hypothetical protein
VALNASSSPACQPVPLLQQLARGHPRLLSVRRRALMLRLIDPTTRTRRAPRSTRAARNIANERNSRSAGTKIARSVSQLWRRSDVLDGAMKA